MKVTRGVCWQPKKALEDSRYWPQYIGLFSTKVLINQFLIKKGKFWLAKRACFDAHFEGPTWNVPGGPAGP